MAEPPVKWDLDFLLEHISAVVAAVAGMSVVFSVAYELGYFSVIDLRLLSLFSMQDAIVGAIHIVPATILAVVVLIVLSRLIAKRRRPDEGRSDPIGWYLVLSSLGLAIYSSVFIAPLHSALAFLVMALIASAVIILKTVAPSVERRRRVALGASGLLILQWFFCKGGIDAHKDLLSTERTHLIVSDKGEELVLILRGGESAVLVRDDAHKVRLIPREGIREIVALNVTPATPLTSWTQVWQFLFQSKP